MPKGKINRNSFTGRSKEMYVEGLRAHKNGVARDKSGLLKRTSDEKMWLLGWDQAAAGKDQW
jgi:hypothetical protein